MFPSKVGVLQQEYGSNLRIAAMAAIQKPDGSVRPLHDATHSVMVNHSIKYQDKIDCPGPAEIASIVRETSETKDAPFCVSADIRAAHRLVKVRRKDWGYMCCSIALLDAAICPNSLEPSRRSYKRCGAETCLWEFGPVSLERERRICITFPRTAKNQAVCITLG